MLQIILISSQWYCKSTFDVELYVTGENKMSDICTDDTQVIMNTCQAYITAVNLLYLNTKKSSEIKEFSFYVIVLHLCMNWLLCSKQIWSFVKYKNKQTQDALKILYYVLTRKSSEDHIVWLLLKSVSSNFFSTQQIHLPKRKVDD